MTYVSKTAVASLGSGATGTISKFGGAAIPSGWLICDGASHLRADYPDLFTAIGTTYGSVDGTHFNVPDLKGRSPMGVDGAGSGEIPTALGQTKGAATHVLDTNQIPSHAHGMVYSVIGGGGSPMWNGITSDGNGVVVVSATAGSGGAHNSVHPVLGVHFMIKT